MEGAVAVVEVDVIPVLVCGAVVSDEDPNAGRPLVAMDGRISVADLVDCAAVAGCVDGNSVGEVAGTVDGPTADA